MNYIRNFILVSILLSSGLLLQSQENAETYISTEKAAKEFSKALKKQLFYIFPETREYPVKWYDSLKLKWLEHNYVEKEFVFHAQPGEYFVYQIGVWAIKKDLQNINVTFSELEDRKGQVIPVNKMTCFNEGGIDFQGKPFVKEVNLTGGRVQAMWMGVNLAGIPEGNYKGNVSITTKNETQTIPFQLEVRGPVVTDHGYDQGKRLSRLNWLNSTAGIDAEITKGYLPVKIEKNKIKILGRTLNIGKEGLPASIVSFFGPSNQEIKEKGTPLINHPFRFTIEKEDGEIIRLQPGSLEIINQTPSKISWKVLNTADVCELECTGLMEFDGFVDYKLALKAKKSLNIKDIRLEIPVNKDNSEYMMGLNHEGGTRPPAWQWQWDTTKNQDMLWIGSVNAGLRIKWKAENYVRPLVNIYYSFGPLNLPPSWGNHSKGGVILKESGEDLIINAYSGKRKMKPGEILNYDFELLITPFHTISKKIKYGDRYFHGGGRIAEKKVEMAEKAGANILNIHHAEDIYPFINYPYLDDNIPALKKLVNDAHRHDIRLKLYYTTRELTINLPEFWAFYSLDGEVIYPGPGNNCRTLINKNGPGEWLKKNLREKYIPAWYNKISEGKFKGEIDLSVITNPDSRLNNFYCGGLNWMVRNLNIDGIYIDDAALDRGTIRRARKIIDQYRPEGRIDMHSWNHFNKWAGFTSCLNLYMDLLPYIDLVWIGEGRNYDRMPDHWLVEVSGIPFGLAGQMLQGGGNPWRGMVYGITNRAGYAKTGPTEIWKFWDQYNMADKKMMGYWDKNTPVTCSNDSVKATLYYGEEESILAIAGWGKEDQSSSLSVDWEKLGYHPSKCTFFIPAIKDYQEEKKLDSLDKLIVPAKKGFLIIVRKKKSE